MGREIVAKSKRKALLEGALIIAKLTDEGLSHG